MTDQRNMFLAIVISMAILFGWDFFFAPDPPPQTGSNEVQQELATPDAPLPSAPGLIAPATPTPADRSTAITGLPRATIETPSVHGTIPLVGLRFDDLTLAGYHETQDTDSAEIVLLSPAGAPSPYYAELGWLSADASLPLPDAETTWSTGLGKAILTPDRPLVLTWDNSAGLTFRRTVTIDQDYMFTVYDEVENNTDETVSLFPYGLIARIGTPEVLGFFILHEGPLGVFDETLKEVDYDDLIENSLETVTSSGGWIGFTDKYWLAALAHEQDKGVEAAFRHSVSGGRDRFQTDFRTDKPLTVAPRETAGAKTYLFAGAKQVELLDGYTESLGISRFDLSIDFGWFYFLTKPFFYALIWLAGVLGNFGLAILGLTIGLRLLLFPLANKQFRAMTKLKKLQPEMKKLQERYADDRTRMNQELMELYKREKANPAAGCLPILVQIPIFFALYKVLFVTIEMRQEPFYGWIGDLSAPDPTSIFNLFGLLPYDVPTFMMIGAWPIIMGVTMWLQQKLNPAPADPMQAKIMSFLPIIFTFLLATFPAGLVIYWAWSNALGILQQWVIMRQAGVKA
ncbi:MAG: membrane protein insertase YidC [Rhodospirillaceae bacterium]|jgi:YidC/Oxa1 family membrane protein insertase|nr:membrane protein insertase YidC [Rhodospirillaceae bacterium]